MLLKTFVTGFTLWSVVLGLAEAGEARTVITGTVKSKGGQPLPGLALLEKDEIHNNVWDRGVLVEPRGRFAIELHTDGQHGLQAYSSCYIITPQAAADANVHTHQGRAHV